MRWVPNAKRRRLIVSRTILNNKSANMKRRRDLTRSSLWNYWLVKTVKEFIHQVSVHPLCHSTEQDKYKQQPEITLYLQHLIRVECHQYSVAAAAKVITTAFQSSEVMKLINHAAYQHRHPTTLSAAAEAETANNKLTISAYRTFLSYRTLPYRTTNRLNMPMMSELFVCCDANFNVMSHDCEQSWP